MNRHPLAGEPGITFRDFPAVASMKAGPRTCANARGGTPAGEAFAAGGEQRALFPNAPDWLVHAVTSGAETPPDGRGCKVMSDPVHEDIHDDK
ncbi:hypothetical protein ACSMXM_05595 [Pacificimonas sp. ICDLI1SI03]